MAQIFTIDVLPAQRGDALWIEYGDAASPHRVIIDGGITKTGREHLKSRLANLPTGSRIELLVVTHIDLDHIQGAIEVLKTLPAHVKIDEIWFNGRDQLPPLPPPPPGEEFGVLQGLDLMKLLDADFPQAWNRCTLRKAICIAEDGSPTSISLPGGMEIKVVSPDKGKLLKLHEEWKEVVEAFGSEVEEQEAVDDHALAGFETMGGGVDIDLLADVKFSEDKGAPNGSSIGLLLSFAGKSALMLGDAHPSLVVQSLKQLSPAQPLNVDCVKVSHHGSRKNTNRELAAWLRSPTWIFSSNGAQTKHPNPEAVARILKYSKGKKSLFFNYRTTFNERWDNADLQEEHGYRVVFGGESGNSVRLISS